MSSEMALALFSATTTIESGDLGTLLPQLLAKRFQIQTDAIPAELGLLLFDLAVEVNDLAALLFDLAKCILFVLVGRMELSLGFVYVVDEQFGAWVALAGNAWIAIVSTMSGTRHGA